MCLLSGRAEVGAGGKLGVTSDRAAGPAGTRSGVMLGTGTFDLAPSGRWLGSVCLWGYTDKFTCTQRALFFCRYHADNFKWYDDDTFDVF
jgi:hypothetical protein